MPVLVSALALVLLVGAGVGGYLLVNRGSQPSVPVAAHAAVHHTTSTSIAESTTTTSSVALSTSTTLAVPSAPTQAEINDVMSRTVVASNPSINFGPEPNSEPLTISDGRGGLLTAVIGMHTFSADGHGQLVFFFHNTTYLGTDAAYESATIKSVVSLATSEFDVSYASYSPNDPLCCPSLAPVIVRYTYNGSEFSPDGTPPRNGTPAAVMLRP
jgi:LppP/LprE lipoprotein